MRDAGGCRPRAAGALEEAGPDAPSYLDFPASHWRRLRTSNVQERTNREIKRRPRVAQASPSEASLTRLVGAVMREQDEAWSESRYFSEARMAELYAPEAPTEEREKELRLIAGQATRASLELADAMEAA